MSSGELILIYQMGKTGSQTVERTVRSLKPDARIVRTHFLSLRQYERLLPPDATDITPEFRDSVLHQRREAEAVLRAIDECSREARVRVITASREPVGQCIAGIFQNLAALIPTYREQPPVGIATAVRGFLLSAWQASVAGVAPSTWRERLLESLVRMAPCWFDEELRAVLGIDIFTRQMSPGTPLVFNDGPFDVLFFRLEDGTAAIQAGLQRLFGLDAVTVLHQNVSSGKDYNAAYSEFRNHPHLPVAFLDDRYGSRYARCIYSAAEIDQLRSRWSADAPVGSSPVGIFAAGTPGTSPDAALALRLESNGHVSTVMSGMMFTSGSGTARPCAHTGPSRPMSTDRLNTTPSMLTRVVSDGLWGDSDFSLIDVGASGGIERHWWVFGDRLRAVGFEPLLTEAERLRQEAIGTKIHYEAAFVTARDFDVLFPPEVRNNRIATKNNDPFQRVSAVRAQEVMRMNYAESVFNLGAPAVYTDRRVVLDEYIPPAERRGIDFIKIDTDGHDFEVLLGADQLLRAGGALGLSIEAQFHGPIHDAANTFANIDRYMRERGFSLFDLEVYRYSRASLPAPFEWDIPAQTTTGQVLWGEAVYFRDLANPDYGHMWPYDITRERVLKLASLFELFGMPDCAAELLVNHRALVGGDCDALLDLLVAPGSGTPGAYRDYIAAFEADPQALYRSRRLAAAEIAAAQADQSAPTESLASAEADERAAMAAEVERLRSRVSELKKKTSDLLDRVKRRDEQIEELTRQGR